MKTSAKELKGSWDLTGGAALFIAQFYKPALPGKDFGGQFAAVLTGHSALDAFDDG